MRKVIAGAFVSLGSVLIQTLLENDLIDQMNLRRSPLYSKSGYAA